MEVLASHSESFSIMETLVSHSESHSKLNPFIHMSLFASVHRTESLVWFETSGFCYAIAVES